MLSHFAQENSSVIVILTLTDSTEYVLPELHRSSQLHLCVFASVQVVDKMSKLHAEPIKENATAKQRTVRQLCAYHISQSSSSNSMNIKQDSARRVSWRDVRNKEDSQNHVQALSSKEDTLLFRTERLIPVKHENREDPTLTHKTHSEENKKLKELGYSEFQQKF